MRKIMILYVPILHNGYLKFFKKWAPKVDRMYVLGQDIIDELTYLEKEIRAIDPKIIKHLIESLSIFTRVRLLTHGSLKNPLENIKDWSIVTAQEGVSERLIDKYFKDSEVEYDSIFLRWDEKHVAAKKPVNYKKVSTDEFDRKMIALATKEGKKTSDWWREVGAIVVKDKKVILTAYNHHIPSEHSPYALGDIRDFIEAGKNSDIQSALHAEKGIVTEAARRVDVGLEGASIYLTVFPCSDCAQIIAYTGIKKCYFSGGHATFNGEEVLAAQGVETILVK